jgi:hypothetical protein
LKREGGSKQLLKKISPGLAFSRRHQVQAKSREGLKADRTENAFTGFCPSRFRGQWNHSTTVLASKRGCLFRYVGKAYAIRPEAGRAGDLKIPLAVAALDGFA